MTIKKKLFSFGLAILADMSLGIFCASGLGKLTHHRVAWFEYGLAMFFGILPDMDVLAQFFREKKIDAEHKSWTHIPMLMIPAVLIISFLANACLHGTSLFWAFMPASCIFAHLVHDMCERGPGVAIFAPFSNRKYRRPRFVEGKLRIRMSGRESAIERTVTLDQWLEREYLHVTANSTLGVIMFCLAVSLVLIDKLG